MAAKKGVDQGKTAFLTDTLRKNPGATEPEIVAAWKSAGNEGTISGSLIYKVRTRLGVSSKGRASRGPALRGRPKASVAAATGLDSNRGDQLVVEAFPFESKLTAEPIALTPVTAFGLERSALHRLLSTRTTVMPGDSSSPCS